MTKIGIYEKSLLSHSSWSQRLQIAAETGYDFFEMSVDESDRRLNRLTWTGDERAGVRRAVADSGVPIHTIILSAHRLYPLGSASPEIGHQALDILRRTVDLAVDIGVRVIQLAGYHVFYEPHEAGTESRFLARLRTCVSWAGQAGVMLGIENVDGDDITSISAAVDILREVDSPWLRLYPDVGNLLANGRDVCAELRLGRGAMVGVHLKDARPGVFRRVAFGDGDVPFVDVFRTLANVRYEGPFALEMWNDDALDFRCTIQRAREWIVQRMAEGGLADLP